MYRRIDRDKLGAKMEDVREVRRDASYYVRNRRVFDDIRMAYMRGDIDKQQLLTLRGQVKAGDADGAVKGLAKLVRRTL